MLENPKERHKIFFCDIASAKLEPSVLKTWAVVNETPVINLNSSGHKFGVLGGINSEGEAHGEIIFGSVTGVNTVVFLKNLLNKFDCKITVVFDNGRNLKCHTVKNFVNSEEKLDVVYLPPYAPDCNPAEFLWAWIRRDLGSLFFSNVDNLIMNWQSSWLEVVKSPSLIQSFFQGSRVADLLV